MIGGRLDPSVDPLLDALFVGLELSLLGVAGGGGGTRF